MSTTSNKWALVTGSARRIGRAIALELATHGWNIVVHYHHSADDAATLAKEIMALGRQAALAEIDLAETEHVARLIPSLAKELGHLSVLVNNASLFEQDAHDPDGHRHRAVNAEAPRILSEQFYQQIPADETGAIVNLLDGVPAEKGFQAYMKSKNVLQSLTLDMAKRFAPIVRVNGVAPGPVVPSARQTPEHFLAQREATLLKTCITPDDIARAAYFLLTSPAITGEILHVDGGGQA